MRKKWKSKGQVHGPLIAGLEFIISLTAVFLLLQIGYDITSGVHDQKLYYARDLAFTAEAIESTHLNMDYHYDLSGIAPLQFEFLSQVVGVRGVEKALQATRHPIHTTSHAELSGNFTDPEGLLFSYQGGVLKVNNYANVTVNFHKERCDALPVITAPLFLLDPGHGGSDQGHVSTIVEAEQVRRIAYSVKGLLGNILPSRDLQAEQSVSLTEKQTLFTQYGTRIGGVLSLHMNQESSTQNNLVLYVNAKNDYYDESYALACNLLNELITFFPHGITGAAIVPLDMNMLSEDDPAQILSPNVPGVLIELGNIDYAQNLALTTPDDVGKVIAKILQHTWKPREVNP